MRPLLALALATFVSLPAWAADAPPAPPKDGGGEGPSVPEVHKIYVPYRDLQKVFEKEGQGVFLPYAEFRALWDKAYRMPDDPTAPPVPAALRSAFYEGVAGVDGIRFTARIEVEVLAKGWQRVALGFGGVGIEEARIGDRPALLVPTANGYDLLLEGPTRAVVDLVLRLAAPATGDTHVAEMSVPSVPLARLALRVPGTDTDVQVEPRLAGSVGAQPDGTTELLAYLGPATKVKLTWRRRPDEGARVDPLVFASETTDVLVDRGVVRTDFNAALSVLRAPLESLSLLVPKDAVVLFVDGPGIKTWERSAAGDRIEVTLREPVKEKWSLHVGLERAIPDLPAEISAPFFGIDRLERETGFLRLRPAEGVKVDPRAAPGLVQVDLSEVPATIGPPGDRAAAAKAFAWRHAGRLAGLTVAVEALAPRVSVAVGTRLGLLPDGIEVRTQAQVTVERAGVFGLELDVPAALEVTDVQVAGAELDDWTRRPGEAGRSVLSVSFRDRLLGAATLHVAGRLPLTLAEVDGTETPVDLPIPRIRGAEHVRGYLALHADPALDRRETRRDGLTVLESDAPGALEPPALPARALPLAARFEHREGQPSLALAVKRKAATVTGTVETALRLEPDRTRIEVRLGWLVQFRGVDRLRFRGPADLAQRVHLGPAQPGMDLLEPVPEKKPEGAPADWKSARVTWTLVLSAPREGRVDVVLAVDDQPETPLAAGSSRRVAVPVLVPVDPDGKPLANTTLHAAIRRDPLLEVATEKVERGEEIDARELEGATRLSAPDTFLAFRSWDPEHAVSLLVTKHEYEPVAEVVVSHMHLNTVVPEEGRATTEAFLVVRNNDRQYLELMLPGNANIRAVTVDGKPETPRRGDDGAVRIPLLSNLRKDQAFVVAFVYDHEVERGGLLFGSVRAESPKPLRVSSDLLTWRVLVPRDREYTAFGGDVDLLDARGSWAFQLLSDATNLLRRRPAGRAIDFRSMAADLERGSPFQVKSDGTAFLFGNRTGTGAVSITGANPKAFLFLKLAVLVGAFVGARYLSRALAGRPAGTAAAFLLPALVLLILIVPAGPGLSAVLSAALLGVALAGLVSLVRWFAAARRDRPGRAAPSAPPPPPPPAPPSSPAPFAGDA